MTRTLQLKLKRLIDVGGAAIAALLLSPVLLLIALSIKAGSSGPVFYRQQRLGLEGKPFAILKFRTMVVGADQAAQRSIDGANLVHSADPRITRVGAVLREWSLDELPQLWNVICGDMSLVGPRPDEASALQLYTENQCEKLRMKPGITGLAMINGRNSIPWGQRIEWDIQYIRSFSLMLDVRIVLKTVAVLLRREGIYNPGHDAPRHE